jgi:putative flippase GtrA
MQFSNAHPLLKWIISGGIAFGIDILTLFILVDFFSVYYLLAASIAFFISASTNYFISRYFIFSETTSTVVTSYGKFISISCIGLIIIASLMYLLVDILNVHYLIARIFIAGTVGVSSYYVHKIFSFSISQRQSS